MHAKGDQRRLLATGMAPVTLRLRSPKAEVTKIGSASDENHS